MIQRKEKTFLLILSAPGKLSLQLQGWETLGYSSFTPVLVSLSFTQRHTHMYTHISALHILSSVFSTSFCALWHLLKHIPSQEDKLCTSSVHSIVNIHMCFPWVHTPSSHFHMCKEALEQSTSTTATTHTLLWHFFFPLQHWQRAPYSFCSNLLAKGRESRKIKLLFSLPSLLKGHAKMGLVSPEVTGKKLPTFPYS